MKVEIKRAKPTERQPVALVDSSGNLLLKAHGEDVNYVLKYSLLHKGSSPWSSMADVVNKERHIYEGDSVTITF